MTRAIRVLACLAVTPLLLAMIAAPVAAGSAGRYIVVLKDATEPAAVARDHSARFGAAVSHVYRYALKGYAATISATRLASLRADPRVAFVSEDREVHALDQTLPTGVDRIEGDLS
ncbi:MAG TPA: protease inhibitor I9 family protein, partial [Candidatus Limnocylindrales bacterium]|nr:protease inhibitor I9 family protein [Candidatus Limnocylindrales bacterium]